MMRNNNKLIVRNSEQSCTNLKISRPIVDIYSKNGRVVSQTIMHHPPPTKIRRIVRSKEQQLVQIAIKKQEPCNPLKSEVVLVNGSWDTSNKIPNIIAEMHNVNADEYKLLQNSWVFKPNGESRCFDSPSDFMNSSPKGSDSGIESDCTDGNLSWLLNFKIQELPPVPDTSSTENFAVQNHNTSSSTPAPEAPKILYERMFQDVPRLIDTKKEDTKGTGQSHRYSGPKKPPFTYTELIEHALNEKGELTVSGIYQWISDHFPFYKQNDDRWKNSVRHNLSINPHFRKGGKAVHGAGHLWTIAQKDEKKAWQIKKQRMQQFIQSSYKDIRSGTDQDEFDRELQAATESILGETFRNGENENNGRDIKEDIEVEYINLIDVPNGLEDFLSPPVSKQEIVQECGLGSDFFITDINPNALGLNLTEAEQMAEDGIYEEMTFEYYDLHKE